MCLDLRGPWTHGRTLMAWLLHRTLMAWLLQRVRTKCPGVSEGQHAPRGLALTPDPESKHAKEPGKGGMRHSVMPHHNACAKGDMAVIEFRNVTHGA